MADILEVTLAQDLSPSPAPTTEIPADEPEFQDPFAGDSDKPVDNLAPNDGSPAIESPSSADQPFSNETPNPEPMDISSPPSPSPSPLPPVPPEISTPALEPSQTPVQEKLFELPTIEKDKSPVTQDFVEAESMEQATKVGKWSFSSALGLGLNVNSRYNQFHWQVEGGYRLTEQWELGGLVSYRTVRDQLLGFLALAKYGFKVYQSPQMRMDLLPHGGLGWSLRVIPEGSKFSEGRFTTRVGVDYLVYPASSFAMVVSSGFESYLFALKSEGGSQSYFKDSGPPTQFLFLVGIRFDI